MKITPAETVLVLIVFVSLAVAIGLFVGMLFLIKWVFV